MTSRVAKPWVRIGGLVSLVALALGLVADSINLIDKVQVGLLGRSEAGLIRERYAPEQISFARKAAFLDRYAAHCFDDRETAGSVDVADRVHIDIFRCGTTLLAARVSDPDGNAVMSEIDLPDSVLAGRRATWDFPYVVAEAAAQPASLPERPRAPIVRALCQKATPAFLVIRYQLADGSCMDETVDKSTGAIVSRVNGVSCDCAAFR